MLTRFLPYRLQTRLDNWRHDRACRPVLETAPIRPANDGLVIFSMMGTAVPLEIPQRGLSLGMRGGAEESDGEDSILVCGVGICFFKTCVNIRCFLRN